MCSKKLPDQLYQSGIYFVNFGRGVDQPLLLSMRQKKRENIVPLCSNLFLLRITWGIISKLIRNECAGFESQY